jgi:hypothetical protein
VLLSARSSLVENKGDVVDVAVAPVLSAERMMGWPMSRACAEACLLGESSQRPMCPQEWHMRRCTHPTAACEALLAASDAFGQLRGLDAVEM